MRFKIKLLLASQPGSDEAALTAALATEVERLQQHCAGRLTPQVGFRLRDDEVARVAAGAFDEGRPFDAMLEIVADAADFSALLDACEGFAQRLNDVVDAAGSVALAGSEHVILPGSGPLLVLIANRRLRALSHADFLEYWLDYHGPFAREHTPPEAGLRYRQFHTDEDATARLLRATGLGSGDFDGAAECYYANADAVRQLMGDTTTVDQATADEKKFVDHARCVTSVFTLSDDSLTVAARAQI